MISDNTHVAGELDIFETKIFNGKDNDHTFNSLSTLWTTTKTQ